MNLKWIMLFMLIFSFVSCDYQAPTDNNESNNNAASETQNNQENTGEEEIQNNQENTDESENQYNQGILNGYNISSSSNNVQYIADPEEYADVVINFNFNFEPRNEAYASRLNMGKVFLSKVVQNVTWDKLNKHLGALSYCQNVIVGIERYINEESTREILESQPFTIENKQSAFEIIKREIEACRPVFITNIYGTWNIIAGYRNRNGEQEILYYDGTYNSNYQSQLKKRTLTATTRLHLLRLKEQNNYANINIKGDYQDHWAAGWSSYKTLIGDINGDGADDLIWNSTDYYNSTYTGISQKNGKFTYTSGQTHSAAGWSSYHTLVGDFNGDGKDDLLWNSLGSINSIYVGLSNGNGTFNYRPHQSHWASNWSGFKAIVFDVNGDNKDDIIWNITSDVNRTYVGISNGDGSFHFMNYQQHWATAWQGYEAFIGDINGDGKKDIIWNSTSNINRIYVGISNGNGTFDFKNYQDHFDYNWTGYKTLIADINADGFDDIVWNYLGNENITYIAFSQGNGTFSFASREIHFTTGWQGYQAFIIKHAQVDTIIWNITGDKNYTYQAFIRSPDIAKGFKKLSFSGYLVHQNNNWYGFKTLIGDIDGNGSDDIIWNLTDYNNRIYSN